MGRLINNVSGTIIEFDKGSFDDWCVYLQKPSGERYAPTDEKVFGVLENAGSQVGPENIYSDFVRIYEPTDKEINPEIVKLIGELVKKYRKAIFDLQIGYSILYGGMIAEENKVNAVLGKRMKRLGMHQLMVEGRSPEECATFSRGKMASLLDGIMKEKGF